MHYILPGQNNLYNHHTRKDKITTINKGLTTIINNKGLKIIIRIKGLKRD